ncbi:MAG TPA: response regulator, partial [Anaerolineales bacterium]|nr:response regulator [Anaerolineales bacterium]
MFKGQGHILVVDDDCTNRLKLLLGLKQQGHIVKEAENGQQALGKLRAESFDLVLLDIMMPELDGYQVLEEMKNDPVLRDVPVIVISAQDELESMVRGIELGAEDYLPKPFEPVLLRARIGACLEKKLLRDEQRKILHRFATREIADELMTNGFSLGGKRMDAT